MANISQIKLPNGTTYNVKDTISGYITGSMETDPVFSASAAAGITSSDITTWNSLISDTGKWNDVSLSKSASTSSNTSYVPYLASTSATTSNLNPVSTTPNANYIPKYDSNKYLYSTTPSANDNSTKVATTAYVDSAITALPEPMIFKGSLGTGGTITTLPAASSSNEGFTYKVITAGTYASQSAKIGDTFISDGSSWVLIPSGDEPSGTVTSVGVSNATNGGLSISGSPITSSGSISIGHSNVLTSAQTTQAIYPIKIDKNGHISAYGSAVSIPTKTSDLTNDSGFITSETDPVFTASPAYGITSSDITNWNSKQAALVSGTNIKTINNESLLGSGNIITPYEFYVNGTQGNGSQILGGEMYFTGSGGIYTNVSDQDGESTIAINHTTSAGFKHIPSGGSTGQILDYGGSSGTASWNSLKTINNTSLLGSGNINTVAAQIIRW